MKLSNSVTDQQLLDIQLRYSCFLLSISVLQGPWTYSTTQGTFILRHRPAAVKQSGEQLGSGPNELMLQALFEGYRNVKSSYFCVELVKVGLPQEVQIRAGAPTLSQVYPSLFKLPGLRMLEQNPHCFIRGYFLSLPVRGNFLGCPKSEGMGGAISGVKVESWGQGLEEMSPTQNLVPEECFPGYAPCFSEYMVGPQELGEWGYQALIKLLLFVL